MSRMRYQQMAREHWYTFLPQKVAELKAEGMLAESLQIAAIQAHQEVVSLMEQGWQKHEAEEVALANYILLKPEPGADLLDWEEIELAEKEREYQHMMRNHD